MQQMLTDLAKDIAGTLAAALKSDSSRIKALALAEGEALAQAVVRIGGLFARGEVDRDEAALLLRIQRDASEVVLASLAEVSRVAASKAVATTLRRMLDKAPFPPLFAGVFKSAIS